MIRLETKIAAIESELEGGQSEPSLTEVLSLEELSDQRYTHTHCDHILLLLELLIYIIVV